MKHTLVILAAFAMAACTSPPGVSQPTASPSPAGTTSIPPTEKAAPSATSTSLAATHPWWNDTVFYEIFVRNFYDSNVDGIGDFNGLLEKLDYLNDGDPNTTTDLGVTGIWLMPIHPSPSSHGYDVTDYYAVNPQYGTLDDFRRLVDEVHRRGMRIIIDLPLNHTSTEHPWFLESLDPQSEYRDWYVWSDADPGFKGPWGQQVWYPLNGAFYYAFFWEGMPDLNYTNDDVTDEMKNVTRFWLEDVGIDGFRLDAIGALIEEGPATVETRATHDWFTGFFSFYKTIDQEAMTIAEVWAPDSVVVPYVANHEVDLAFEFDLSAAMLASLNDGNASRILEVLRSGTSRFPPGQFGVFLTNHDMARVMTQLGGNPTKAKAAASLYFALPGVPFLYYGEEIGMLGEGPRPMQWTGGPNAGFSDVTPWQPPDATYKAVNVSVEADDPQSLLSHYRELISVRSTHPALRTGELLLLSTSDQGTFACLRTNQDESLLVIVNLTPSPIRDNELSLDSTSLPQGNYDLVPVSGNVSAASLTVLADGQISGSTPVPEIAPYATVIMLLQPK